VSAAPPVLPAGYTFELSQTPEHSWQFGTLVYRERECVLEVDLERSGVPGSDWLTVDSAFCQWSEPAGVALEPEHIDRVLARLAEWSRSTGVRFDIAPAVDPLLDLQLSGYRLERQPDGSVLATPPPRPAGLLRRLFGL